VSPLNRGGRVGAVTGWHYLSDEGNKATQLALAAHTDDRMHALMIGEYS